MEESNKIYKDFILRYFKEQGITYDRWLDIQPLYLRYRGRCLKMKPQNYEQFRNLCLFESNRHTKYDDRGVLKTGEEVTTRKDYDKPKDYAGVYYTAKQARTNYKLNYKEPPRKEDFEIDKDYRNARHDWSYVKDQLAEFRGIQALAKAQWKRPLVPKEIRDLSKYRYMFQYPFLIRFALRCLSGEYPIEAYPEVLNDIKGELQKLLDSQREVYNQEPVNFKFCI